jgi:predicted MFS family arabinose efflux permease
MIAVAAGLVLPGLAWNLESLTVALVLWGVCLGTLDISMNTQGVALERRYGRSIMSRLHATFSAAVLVFSALGGLAAALGVSPLVHFAVIGGVSILVTQPLRGAMLPEIAPRLSSDLPRATPSTLELARPERTAKLQLASLAAVGFCALVTEGAVVNWSGVLLHRNDHSSLTVAPLGLTTFSLGMVTGRWVGDRVITRFGYRATVRSAAAIAVAGTAIASAGPWLPAALAGYVILGLGLSVLVPIVFVIAGRSPGVSPVQALARLTTVTYAGLFLGPPIIGIVASLATLRVAMLLTAALLAGATAVAQQGIRLKDEQLPP